MKYLYHRDNNGKPVNETIRNTDKDIELLTSMFEYCSREHREKLKQFLADESQPAIEFEFKDGDRVTIIKQGE